ncbi:hypothetical protein CK203_091066 [Vitis vinifera]|uniref:Retrotransposon gag domain-containing protein n=1 Tax=Vitis vinifera TaxID=29760 RepID=A0A438FH70_VITVI|nr:hypothetical protein CK203_091066 [Vitis vinifera]
MSHLNKAPAALKQRVRVGERVPSRMPWLVSEQAPEMAGGSAMEALRERMTQIKEALGEWPREDGTVASWAEHTRGEVQAQRRDPTVLWRGHRILKKAVLQGSASGPEAPSKFESQSLKASMATETRRNWRISCGTSSSSLRLLMFLMARRMEDDAESGRPQITTWETLKKELKNQFLPTNTAWVAREALKRLRHIGTVREYVKEFSSLMLDTKNMSEEDKLFNFMSGLQGWAQKELWRQGVRDLPTAMVAADCLVDYKMGGAISTTQRPKSDGGKKAKAEGKAPKKLGWKKQGKGLLQEES